MRIGLYGGSFDPVHRGHLLVAQAALEELCLDRLVFIPAAQSPFKQDSLPAPCSKRLRWLRLALAGQSRCRVDPIELARGGVSYTIDTVRHFKEHHSGATLFYLIGADHVSQLPLWREAESLAGLVEFVVIPRPGEKETALPPPFRLHHLRGWPLAVSSSLIRDRLRNRLTVRHLVPDPVGEILESESAYGGRSM